MSLRVGNRSFAPAAWSLLLTGLGLAVFVWLGWWQLGRAEQKQARIDAFVTGSATTLDATHVELGGLPRYQSVRLRGAYEPDRQVLLDNMPSAAGRPGYRVLTLLEREGGSGWVLVDRGWVPLGTTRAELPDTTVEDDEREVSGLLDDLPAPGIRLGPAEVPGTTGWPRVMLFPTQADLESALGVEVAPRILLLDPGRPDGFERLWQPLPGLGPQRHVGYAVQWFALALATVVLFVALNLRRTTPAEERRDS